MPEAVKVDRAGALKKKLDELEEQFKLDTDDLHNIVSHFIRLYQHGLGEKGAAMAMIPSFVTGVPDGSEKGTYLALDLGGTNLRVCEVTLDGKSSFTIKQEKYRVSDTLKQGPVAELFDYIAQSVDRFLSDYGSSSTEDELLMGFTFSFPVEQTAIDRGTLISWTKGFNCPDAIGKDVVKLLQSALDKKHIKVRVNALVNDTVGALLAHGYHKGSALLGAIFGTGTNGAYVERLDRIQKLKVKNAQNGPTDMIVNTEWGGFDDARDVLPVTTFDNFVDRLAIRQRHHVFEKMISGLYLGELVRAVFLYLIDSLLLFSGFSSAKLNKQYGFDTALVSAIEADTAEASDPKSATRKVFVDDLGVAAEHVSDTDVETVRTVCRIVATRAARLSATALACTLIHTGYAPTPGQSAGTAAAEKSQGSAQGKPKTIHIGVDGSVVEFLPQFQDRMRDALREMVGKDVEGSVELGLAKDGSGVGAALCALQASKQEAAGHRVEA